ncbi:Catechol 2,3-dioxygenase [Jatrophihabitans endophyticus]|uniref:Catechol 2,3-dioxygenase n=1 Tax=Jatrophihabitans endophyticus TaxID=1206085 RepID=A0A1M5C6A1_9ACTN|nr:VOC family protein [Jatrophihabitans endophyticus]SHF50273.1 Catechol 2,3-dioxygenase [Jatrophihabitans endophyticus]
MTPHLDSVTVGASDFAASAEFYEAALGALGFVRTHELVDEEEDDAAVEALGWGPAGAPAQVWLVTSGVPTRDVHVRLRVASRLDVEEFHSAALAAGGREHAAPRRWTPYRRGEFNAIVRDPDGNLVEAVAPE